MKPKDLTQMGKEELETLYQEVNREDMLRGSEGLSNVVPGSLVVKTFAPDDVHAVYEDCTVHAGYTGEDFSEGRCHYVPLHQLHNLETGMPYSEVKVSGHSMEPAILDGDIVVFSQGQQVMSGMIAVVRYEHQTLVKYLIDDEEHGCYWLESINPEYEMICVRPGDDFAVFGPFLYAKRTMPSLSWYEASQKIEKYVEEHVEEFARTPLVLTPDDVPAPLATEQAKMLWGIAHENGWVDDFLQPRVSQKKAAILGSVISDLLQLSPRWVALEKLWRIPNLGTKLSQAQTTVYYSKVLKSYSEALCIM